MEKQPYEDDVDIELNASEMETAMFLEKLLNELHKHPLIQEIELRELLPERR